MGLKHFFLKDLKKDINENKKKTILLNAMMLFDIRNGIASLFRNSFIKPLQYQSTKNQIKSEESIAERTQLRRQRLDEIIEKEKKIDLELFKYYFKYSNPSNMYKRTGQDKNRNK